MTEVEQDGAAPVTDILIDEATTEWAFRRHRGKLGNAIPSTSRLPTCPARNEHGFPARPNAVRPIWFGQTCGRTVDRSRSTARRPRDGFSLAFPRMSLPSTRMSASLFASAGVHLCDS
jgi:hypothetical protein